MDRRKEGILEFLPAIHKETVDSSKGAIKARVTTVAPLTESQVNGLKKRLDKLYRQEGGDRGCSRPADFGRDYDSSRQHDGRWQHCGQTKKSQ